MRIRNDSLKLLLLLLIEQQDLALFVCLFVGRKECLEDSPFEKGK